MVVLAFEMVALAVFSTGDMFLVAALGAAVIGPLLLFLYPKEPIIGVPFMFVATGLNMYALITQNEGSTYNFAYFHILLVVTVFCVFANFMLRQRFTIPSLSLWMPMVLLLTCMFISLIYTPLFFDGFMEVARLAALYALSAVMIFEVDTKRKIVFTLWTFLLVPVAIAAITLRQILTEGEFFQSQIINVAQQLGLVVFRSTGTFFNPNDLATFLMIGIIVGFGMLFIKDIRPVIKAVIFISVGLCAIAIISTFSRGGWVATFFGLVFLIAMHRKWSYFMIFLMLGVGTVAIVAAIFPDIVVSALSRFLTLFDPTQEISSSSRLGLIKTGLRIWEDFPVFGAGIAGFSYYAPTYMDPSMPSQLSFVILPHTIQSKILTELGIVGFTVGAWFFFTVLFEGMRDIFRNEDNFLMNAQIIFTSLYFAFIVAFTFNSDLHHNIFWMTVGMIYAVSLTSQKSRQAT